MAFELNRRNLILIGILIIAMLVFVLLIDYRNPKLAVEPQSETRVLEDYSRFFMVSNAAENYLNYLAKQDSTALNLLLSEDYKTLHNINQHNVLTKLELLSTGNYTFMARKIYQESLSTKLVKYYVAGDLKETLLDTYTKPTRYYLIIIMDTEHFTYSVVPDDGSLFKEA